ncbi:MAG TPA: glycosyltransferase [Thermoanaerobacterales bacterium]|nr:glycosyltransferase [Thermoanaerobacterales bacterium]
MNSLDDVLVSVIIPVYNVEKYLRRCIDSVVNQTHRNIEIILVDDGSPDACPEICDEYAKKDSRVIVIHQCNQGLSAARNAGIDASRGDWLCFVDSDDFVDPRFITELLEAAVTNDCLTARCKRKFVYTDQIDEKQPEAEYKVFNWFEYAAFLDNTPGYTIYSVCWGIYHKSLFENLRFPPYRHTEDAPVSTQVLWLAREKKFAVTNQTLYYYYQRPSSILRGSVNVNVLDRYEAFEWIFDFWKSKNEPEIADVYFRMYFTYLVLDYTNLCRDLPEDYSKYSHLHSLIERNAHKAQLLNLKITVIPSVSQDIWEWISKGKEKFILYGYENIGREIYPWLVYFNVDIKEIWDQNADQHEDADEIKIPFLKPHDAFELKDNIVIILTIEDEKQSLIIRRKLRQMGYSNFISCGNIFGAVKYAKYKKFLPFLLTNKG